MQFFGEKDPLSIVCHRIQNSVGVFFPFIHPPVGLQFSKLNSDDCTGGVTPPLLNSARSTRDFRFSTDRQSKISTNSND